MKLLIITQAIDTEHPLLGFFHRWIEEFAKHCEQVHVICLQEGEHALPNNVYVHSLGKETRKNRIVYLLKFYKLIWILRHEYDNVFVHMNQIYVVLGAPLWRVLGKKIGLWYVHRTVSVSLKVAEKFVDSIFTSSKLSINLNSKKIQYLGHGIDTNFWKLATVPEGEKIKFVYIGRISPIKNIEKIFDITELFLNAGKEISLSIIGGPSNGDDLIYQETLKKKLSPQLAACVTWHGPVTQTNIRDLLTDVHVHLNCSPTGGADKSVLETMSMGIPSIVVNKTFSEIFPEVFESLTIDESNKDSAMECLSFALELSSSDAQRERLHNLVKEKASLTNTIKTIISSIS